jgi:His/Glu/Gln/Arg/opine family amino acid ABC transporter permease subunit
VTPLSALIVPLAVFSWEAFWGSFQPLLPGAIVTIALATTTMAASLPFGLALALLRLSRFGAVRVLATGWVELFRSTPLLLQVFWVFYVLPATFHIRFPEFWTGVLGLTCNVSAFNSETFRAGILSVRPGQSMAGRALGMTPAQLFRRVVFPQAARRVIPPLASTWVSLFKDTALVSTIAIADLSYKALELRTRTYRTLEVLSALAIIYLLLGYPQAKLSDWVYRSLRVAE